MSRLARVGFVAALGIVAALSVVSLRAGQRQTSLSSAIQNGDRPAIAALLKAPGAAKVAEPDGTTPLHWAMRADDLETARQLIRAGASVGAANRHGVTPLSLAAVNGSAAGVELLLGAGADANTVIAKGQTVLMTAARTGNAAAVQALLARGATVNAREDQQGETALMWAASENHAAVVKLLIARGADVEAKSKALTFPKDRFGLEGVLTILPKGEWTPLMYAARDGAADATRALIEAGAKVNIADADGTTPLLRAIANSHYDTAAVLLEHGADPNLVDNAGMGALYGAVDMSSLGEVYGLPGRKVNDRHTALDIVRLALAKGAAVNAKLKTAALQRNHTPGEGSLGAGSTALMRAAKHGDHAAMKVLLDAGAEPGTAQPNGTTVLMFAAGLGRGLGVFAGDVGTEADLLAGATLLVDRGVDVNASRTDGITALHYSAQAGLNSLVTLLAARGAAFDAKDKQGRTPADMAMGVGGRGRAGGPPPVFKETAELLRRLAAERGGAQARPAAPSTVRMYIFDSDVLRIADPQPLFGLRKDQVAASDLADGAYLIVHPKGTLMWEAGLVPDAAIGGPNARPGAPTTKLRDAMAVVGYKPSDITYLALSHGHGDHTANANDFAASTWLVNKAEHDAMFSEKVPRFYTAATYQALKGAKTTFITGDHDVFGDGTVIIRQTPGHTAGHQVLIVKLEKTGVVALPGDLYHYPEEVPMRTVAPAQGDEALTLAARDALQAYLKQTRGQMWITHDLLDFQKLKKAPEFYD